MQASAQTCGRNKADSMIQNVSYGQYTWIIPHRVVQLLSFWVPGDKAAPPTSLLVSSLGSKWSIDTVIHFYFSSFLIHRRALFALNQPEARFAKLGEYSQNKLSEVFWTANIASSQFIKYPELGSQSKTSPN